MLIHPYEQRGGVSNLSNWIASFTTDLGNCSVIEAELWAFLIRLQLAWAKEIRHLIAEVDSRLMYE